MFVYTTVPYPTYSPPMLYPLSHYVVAPSVPTAGERYLRTLTDAQAMRESYILELEEQRILASLRQQEALRQAEFRQQQILAAQNAMTRRRMARTCASGGCQPAFFPAQPRRQAYTRKQRCIAQAQERQNPLKDLEEVLLTLLGGGEAEDAQELLKKRQKLEEDRAEQARKAAVHNARVRFVSRLAAIHEEIQASRVTCPSLDSAGPTEKSTQAAQASLNAEAQSDTPAVPLNRQPEIPRNRNRRDRAARTIQRRWRSHSADAAARKDALNTISTLQSRLQFLTDTFSFPEHLEFRRGTTGQHVPALVFTPANAAVHAYTHELTKLLMLADAVPSGGSHQVREERRTFVRLVEEALDSVEARVAKIWGKRVEDARAPLNEVVAPEAAPAAVPIEVQETANDVEQREFAPDASESKETIPTSVEAASFTESNASASTPDSIVIPVETSADIEQHDAIADVSKNKEAESAPAEVVSSTDSGALTPSSTVTSSDDRAPPTVVATYDTLEPNTLHHAASPSTSGGEVVTHIDAESLVPAEVDGDWSTKDDLSAPTRTERIESASEEQVITLQAKAIKEDKDTQNFLSLSQHPPSSIPSVTDTDAGSSLTMSPQQPSEPGFVSKYQHAASEDREVQSEDDGALSSHIRFTSDILSSRPSSDLTSTPEEAFDVIYPDSPSPSAAGDLQHADSVFASDHEETALVEHTVEENASGSGDDGYELL